MPVQQPMTRAWSLAGRTATAADGARLDLDAPGRGIVLADGRDAVLGVDLRTACPVGDHWLRGADLIAVYEPVDARRLRATALWRPWPGPSVPGGSAWELTLSAQTALVQSDSALAVACDVGCGDLRWSRDPAGTGWTGGGPPHDATCLLLRRPAPADGPRTTVLLAVHPADARRIVVGQRDGRAAVACWLFSTALEKGVLMRGRVLAAVGPTDDDEAWAGRLVAAFAAEPPPLTA